MLFLKRVYESAGPKDGFRILVDRLWPRGIRKEKIDLWLKEIAPSEGLRKWYNHDSDQFLEFKRRYWMELNNNKDNVIEIMKKAMEGNVTLVFAAQQANLSNAVVLKEYLDNLIRK
jgi:uncharacterized protein YeaO (DUF488 family)